MTTPTPHSDNTPVAVVTGAARGIGLDELSAALRAANVNTPVGTLEGPRQTLTLQANQQLKNAAEFAELIVAQRNGNPVRLRDVARIEEAAASERSRVRFNGVPSVSTGISPRKRS